MKKVIGSFLVLSAIVLSSIGASNVQLAKKQGCGKAGCPHVAKVSKKGHPGPAISEKQVARKIVQRRVVDQA